MTGVAETSCVATLVAYAREQALLPVPVAGAGPEWEACWSAARAQAARLWLLLPVLWQARTGDLVDGWRGEVRAAARAEAAASVEVAAAVMELGEMPRQAWEPLANVGTRPATDAWYQAMSTMLLDAWALVYSGAAHHRIDRDNPWYTDTVPTACQNAGFVLAMSYRSARTQAEHGDKAAAAVGLAADDLRLIDAPPPWYWRYIVPSRRRINPDPDELERLRADLIINTTDSRRMATQFAVSMAVHIAHEGRYQVAHAALLLPVLWQARTGNLDPQWRTHLDTRGWTTDPSRASDLQAAAMALAELPTQPWETAEGPEALNAWFKAARHAAYTTYEQFGIAHAGGMIAPTKSSPSSDAMWRACYALIVLTEASYLAAGGQEFPLHRLTARHSDSPDPPPDLSLADQTAVFTAPPPEWAPPASSVDSRILTAVTAQVADSATAFATQRLVMW